MKEKFYYIANIRLPTEKAHGIRIMEMCEAFADMGWDLELLIPKRRTPIKDDPFEYYKVKRNFEIKKIWCIDAVRFGRSGFLIEVLTFTLSLLIHLIFKKGLMYTRDEPIAFVLKLFGKKVVWEAHMGQKNFFVRSLVSMSVPFVVITKGLKDLYEKLGKSPSMIFVAPDGVDISEFNISDSREEAREKIGFGTKEKIVLYTGHLYSWKGADTLAQASKLVSPDIEIIFLGGTEKDIETFREKYVSIPNIKILGKKPHHEIPFYLKAANILTIPNSAKEDISRLYTSPMKLFEYIASGTPVIASDLPSLREVLNESNAAFFKPDSSEDIARSIEEVFRNNNEAQMRAKKAFSDSLLYTWKKRAKDISSFIEVVK